MNGLALEYLKPTSRMHAVCYMPLLWELKEWAAGIQR